MDIHRDERNTMESVAAEGDSPVFRNICIFLSRAEHEEFCLKKGRPRSKAKYS